MKFPVKDRKEIGSNRIKGLRRNHWVPGIIYGHGEKSFPIKVKADTLVKLIHGMHSQAELISIDHEGKQLKALIKEVVRDPLTEKLIHVDFLHIHKDEKVTVQILVELQGESEGVKEGGILDAVHRQLTIRCLPKDIPDNIVLDISELGIGDSIHIKDLELPGEVDILEDDTITIVNVLSPRKVVEVEPEETELLIEERMEEPELISEEESEETIEKEESTEARE